MVGMFDFALRAEGGADDADRTTAVALNFKMEAKGGAIDGYEICLQLVTCHAKTT
jgi:hypothetical protein